jgi:hypothetical protein
VLGQAGALVRFVAFVDSTATILGNLQNDAEERGMLQEGYESPLSG